MAYKQEIALESQCQGHLGPHDCVASLLDIDIEDGFARHLLRTRLCAQRGNEPVARMSAFAHVSPRTNDLKTACGKHRWEPVKVDASEEGRRVGSTYQTVATPYWRLVKTVKRQYCILKASERRWTNFHGSRTSLRWATACCNMNE